ncbi:metal ABC transporter permease [Paenibacillus pasadenensis]|uniref:Manganese ABC transporter, inner membrane permease protein SitD n=1 Tax=Paenibacillus pasadenensis TaxID=217090 RepID=A0A2N5NAB9_9BACL|nr:MULTISPECIES: metal ABC transporter permease [Paenibacillus]PLT47282.1 Manganese ABC transporter, inner membrane permease protein SitD [Paenibacillus pasadenensis]QGG57580.1 iron chelate uptake ABC transporter family permease subunit [Paenibacillus sp. B01]
MSMDFWILLTGSLAAVSCAILGCFLILRRMALIGDAISHSVLPGIVIAYMVSGSRGSILMLVAAAIMGLLCVFLIQWFNQRGIQSDASIGVVFTALFAIGVVLVSLNARQVDLDLDCVLYGEIAYAAWNTLQIGGVDLGPRSVWLLGGTLLLVLAVIGTFYKQFKLCAFDPMLAAAVGIPAALFHYLLMGLVSVATVSSFESVGAILVVGLLVIPPSAAYLLTDRLGVMIGLSALIGVASTVLGYALAVRLDASIAGCIVVAAAALFAASFLLSPKHGLLSAKLRRSRLSRRAA